MEMHTAAKKHLAKAELFWRSQWMMMQPFIQELEDIDSDKNVHEPRTTSFAWA